MYVSHGVKDLMSQCMLAKLVCTLCFIDMTDVVLGVKLDGFVLCLPFFS
jgi:hypothetical protein